MLPVADKAPSKEDSRFLGARVEKRFQDTGVVAGKVIGHNPAVKEDQSDERWVVRYTTGKEEALSPQRRTFILGKFVGSGAFQVIINPNKTQKRPQVPMPGTAASLERGDTATTATGAAAARSDTFSATCTDCCLISFRRMSTPPSICHLAERVPGMILIHLLGFVNKAPAGLEQGAN